MLSRHKEEVAMAAQSGFADANRSSLCFSYVLGFFFNKGVRGGPRVLMNLAGVLVVLIIFVKLLPSNMTESALQVIPLPTKIWSGSSHQQYSVPAGLRIVVFGELDIGTPVGGSQETEGSRSWTEALCDQLACDSHISMVPAPDKASWSISSNEIYAQGIEHVLNETAYFEGPGHDYSFVSASYPPQWKAWDLKAQIDAFLAMPKGPTPAATVWIVNFGQWDVWALSAVPIAVGLETVDAMTNDVFQQVERLYQASTDPNSIAYSDINFIKPAPFKATDNTSSDDPGAMSTEEPPPKATDTFHVLLSPVVEPSLLPGWRDLRPNTPAVHSKAEQMRNSAALTRRWNADISDRLIDWIQKDNADADASPLAMDANTPRPIRDGFAYNMATFVRERIMDRQLRNAHIQDATGLGKGAVGEGYHDVRNACLQPVAHGSVKVNIPSVKLENDMQAPGGGGGAPGGGAEGVEMPGLAYLSTVKECDIPGDHLFYTPFALGQRAIMEIANQTADLIRSGESVRRKLDLERKKE